MRAAKAGTKLARGANFRCVMSGTPIAGDYVKAEGQSKRMGARLMAVVAEGDRGRVYLAPTAEQEEAARKADPQWQPEQSLPDDPRNFWTVLYGLKTYSDLFTPRQLIALTTFSDLVGEAAERVRRDARAAGLRDDGDPLRDSAAGPAAYADANTGIAADGRSLRDSAAEAAGLARTFGRHVYYASVSAPAGALGQTLAASGPLALVCALESMRRREVAPVAGFREPPERSELGVVRETRAERLDCVLVTALGMGGTNASVLLQR